MNPPLVERCILCTSRLRVTASSTGHGSASRSRLAGRRRGHGHRCGAEKARARQRGGTSGVELENSLAARLVRHHEPVVDLMKSGVLTVGLEGYVVGETGNDLESAFPTAVEISSEVVGLDSPESASECAQCCLRLVVRGRARLALNAARCVTATSDHATAAGAPAPHNWRSRSLSSVPSPSPSVVAPKT